MLIGPACGVGVLPVDSGDLIPDHGDGKTSAVSRPACDPLSGSGHTFGVAEGVFEGEGILFIRGEEFAVSITTILLGPPVEGDDGTLHAVTSHTFVFDDDDESSITTIDKAVLEPLETPGWYRINSNMKIASGTGEFDAARGRLHAHGEICLVPGSEEAIFTIRGTICERR